VTVEDIKNDLLKRFLEDRLDNFSLSKPTYRLDNQETYIEYFPEDAEIIDDISSFRIAEDVTGSIIWEAKRE